MTTSRFALLAALSLLAALPLTAALPLVPALAQAPPPSSPMHGQRGARARAMAARAMANSMNFTDAQKAQLRTTLMGAGQQVQAVRANTSLTPAARAAKMQAIQQRVRAQMMIILTPAQRARAQSMAQQSYHQGRPM